MPGTARRLRAAVRRPGHDLETVLAAAVEVFNERGYDGASMEDLRGASGIAKWAIYHHVSGKEELLRMALDRALDGLGRPPSARGPRTRPAIERLQVLVRGAVAVLEDRLPYVTLLLRVRGNTEVERAALARRRAFDAPGGRVGRGGRAGRRHQAGHRPQVTARLLFGLVNSAVEWYRPSASGSIGYRGRGWRSRLLYAHRVRRPPRVRPRSRKGTPLPPFALRPRNSATSWPPQVTVTS